MKAVIYTRVSSEEQLDGHSLSAQAELSQQFARQREWEVVHIFEERGRSGKTALRPEFQRMIDGAEAKLFDVIIVHKLDRFSRSLVDAILYLNRLNYLGVSLVSVSENFDFTTPSGKMMLGMLALFAEWYLDNLSQETSKGKRERARSGGWNGTLPFGYTTLRRLRKMLVDLGEAFKVGKVGDEEYSRQAKPLEDVLEQHEGRYGETDAIICPFNGPGVVLAFEKYSLGIYSDLDIAEMLNNAGYRTSGQYGRNAFGKDTINYMLQSRFHIGETSYKGRKKGAVRESIPGRQEPIISRELFEKCEEVRAKRAAWWSKGAPNQITTYPLSSVLICPVCGSKWRGWHIHSGRRYRDPAKDRGVDCPSVIKSIHADKIEADAASILMSFSLPGDWRERVLGMLTQEQPQYETAKNQQAALQGRMERLKQLFVLGDVSEEEYRRSRDEIQRQLNALPLPTQGKMLDLERAAQLLGNIQTIWEGANLEEREAWFKLMFNKIYLFDGAIKAIEPTPVLWTLLSNGMSSDTRSGDDGIRCLLCTKFTSFHPLNPCGKSTLRSLRSFTFTIVIRVGNHSDLMLLKWRSSVLQA